MLNNKRLAIVVLSLISACLTLGGCGSASKGGSDQSADATKNALAIDSTTAVLDASLPPTTTTLLGTVDGIPTASQGVTTCANCHATAGSPINVMVADGLHTATPAPASLKLWSLSGHALQGTHVDGSDPLCVKCHDPFGDGAKIDDLLSTKGITLIAGKTPGTTVVGCEACHGGGSMHNGLGPLPSETPSYNRCGACHSKSWDSDAALASHKTYHPEGYGIYEDYLSSSHIKSINSHTLVTGSTTNVNATCSRCHTDEGIKTYLSIASGTQDHDTLVANMAGKANIAAASPIQCRTCHDAHEPGTLIGDKDYTVPAWSSEFKTCTACHQLLKADGTKNIPYHDPAANPYGSNEEIITDTHFSVAGSPGYNIDPTNSRACSNCHNPHNASSTVNKEFIQFAASTHLDKTASWDEEGGTTSATCQRCHTTTGFVNYIGLVAANNDGSTTVTNTVSTLTGPGKEMLYCIGCHTNNKGGLRDPKVFQYTIGNDSGFRPNMDGSTVRTIPSTIGGSLNCVHCHSGRRTARYNKETLAYRTDHYLPTASIMFRMNGFEYDGIAGASLSYANLSYFAHDKIGTSASAAPGNGNGPCVGCHMYPGATSRADHRFNIFERDSSGKIVTNYANANTCTKCHAGQYALSVTSLNTVESEYRAAIQALKSVIASKKGLYYKAGDIGEEGAGNFYSDVAQTTVATNNSTTWGTINDFGAGYNLNVLSYAVPGAGAVYHNSLYVRRLIYDSIDFLDNGALDNTVDATIAAITETAAYTIGTAAEFQITVADKAAARAFLKGDTTARP